MGWGNPAKKTILRTKDRIEFYDGPSEAIFNTPTHIIKISDNGHRIDYYKGKDKNGRGASTWNFPDLVVIKTGNEVRFYERSPINPCKLTITSERFPL